jgi:hypothetical protein
MTASSAGEGVSASGTQEDAAAAAAVVHVRH